MALFKPGIEVKLASAERIVLELGCGQSRRIDGAVTVDSVDLASVDIVADLNEGIPLPDASVDAIYSFHFLEHLDDLDHFMKELHRVLKPDGVGYLAMPSRWQLVEPHYRLAFLSWLPALSPTCSMT